MRIAPIAENLLERVALVLGLGPRPMLETHTVLLLAQTIMVATKLGVFESLAQGPLTGQEIAKRCDTDERATLKLLNALASTRYLRLHGQRYSLTKEAARWLLRKSPHSFYDNVRFRFVEWEWIGCSEDFVRTGRPVNIHEVMTESQWDLYQRAMRSLAGVVAPEVVRRTPVPKGARDMLDIGGSHGYFSVGLCRRHPGLNAVIMDLPEAIAQAAPILARENIGDRVVHRVGNALTDDLGAGAYDLILIANLVHHLENRQNRDLVRRAARALRPGGVLVIQEIARPRSAKEAGQAATLGDFYFALTSQSGTLSFQEVAEWQRDAGLKPRKPIRFLSFPGAGQQNAVK